MGLVIANKMPFQLRIIKPPGLCNIGDAPLSFLYICTLHMHTIGDHTHLDRVTIVLVVKNRVFGHHLPPSGSSIKGCCLLESFLCCPGEKHCCA